MVCGNILASTYLLTKRLAQKLSTILPQKNLGQKECKYFNKGVGECPFGNKCFYQHADKEGRSAVYI